MTKKNRHKLIKEIIENHKITTQEDLINHLETYNVMITQTTVSRDLTEMSLSKTRDENGLYYYSLPSEIPTDEFASKFMTIFRESVISIAHTGILLVIKCYTGMGNAACAALDSMNLPEIVGTIAGDDTIFVAVTTEEMCERLIEKLHYAIRP